MKFNFICIILIYIYTVLRKIIGNMTAKNYFNFKLIIHAKFSPNIIIILSLFVQSDTPILEDGTTQDIK